MSRDYGLAGEMGEGIPDGGNSMSSRTMGVRIQQQRELRFCVWRMGQDASWQVWGEQWVGALLPVFWLPFFSKDLDSSWIHTLVLNCTNEAYIHYLVEKRRLLWDFSVFPSSPENLLQWIANDLTVKLCGTKLSILKGAYFLWTAKKFY